MKSSKSSFSNDDRIRNVDFPWLWAVLNYWNPDLSDIDVINTEDSEIFRAALVRQADIGVTNWTKESIWIRHGFPRAKPSRGQNRFELFKVEKIVEKITPSTESHADIGCLAERILKSVPHPHRILNVVVVTDQGGTSEKVRIFRMKHGVDFNDMLKKAIREYERERAR